MDLKKGYSPNRVGASGTGIFYAQGMDSIPKVVSFGKRFSPCQTGIRATEQDCFYKNWREKSGSRYIALVPQSSSPRPPFEKTNPGSGPNNQRIFRPEPFLVQHGLFIEGRTIQP